MYSLNSAGPAGATTSYFIKRELPYLSVCLFDKAKFPRDKYCGDAFCAPALDIMEEMGVLQELEARGLINNTLRGGFVSPSGYSFIANDSPDTNEPKNMATRAYAIKRMICDEALAYKAREIGCELKENAQVSDAKLDARRGVWTVRLADGREFTCNILIAADGAASNIARKLAVVHTAPDGVAARQYIKGGTHNFKADGVLLYPEYTLPGYMALFRHYDGSVDLGAYLLPGGAAKEEDIAEIYSKRILTDPFISRALGRDWEPLERVKVASLRLGGVPKSYAERFFVVGDAAGHIDPLTGEGIHLGMIAGKLLAKIVREMFQTQRFSIEFGARYHEAWMRSFGADFPLSAMAGKIVYKVPFLMDAVPIAATSKGSGRAATQFFGDFGAVMTGVKPKSTFLLPWVAWPMFVASMGVLYRRFWGVERNYFQAERDRIETSFDTQCLIDINVPCGTEEDLAKRGGEGGMNPLQRMFAWKHANAGQVPPPPRVLVAFGTEFGLSSEIASKLCDALFATGRVEPRLIDLEHYECVDFTQERAVLIICSTAGDGDFPQRARAFYQAIPSIPGIATSGGGQYFALLACGDSAYPKFCLAGREMANALRARGALCECRELDGEDTSAYEEWIAQTVAATVAHLERDDKMEEKEDYLAEAARELLGKLGPVEPRATKAHPFMAKLKSKTRLTQHPPCAWGEDKWHIVLDVSADVGNLLRYLPGDALGVLPENDAKECELLARKLGGALAPNLFARKNLKDAPQALATALNLQTANASEAWIADRLPPAPSPMRAEDLKDLQPRFYSICSSPHADKGEIHLCVAAVRYKVAGERETGGVCSTFLIDRLQVGDSVPVFVQSNPDFRAQQTTTGKKLMIGPGTGVAPFRAFVRSELQSAHLRANNLLFFGCRHESGDFLYAKEWRESNQYEVIAAFSRDQEEKVYVQHKILALGARLWRDFLSEAATQIYICGDGLKMARDAEAALVSVAMEHGDLSEKAAQANIKSRLHLDVWVV